VGTSVSCLFAVVVISMARCAHWVWVVELARVRRVFANVRRSLFKIDSVYTLDSTGLLTTRTTIIPLRRCPATSKISWLMLATVLRIYDVRAGGSKERKRM
jgi:hypothetical protein